jgi:uncharacterized protein (TIGR03083 family)
VIDARTIEPLSHHEAMRLQAVELDRALALLRSLDAESWSRQTDCPDWDVRRLYLHVLGACEAGASVRENVHQLRSALAVRKRDGGPLEAALSTVQVREREGLTPAQVVDHLASVAPKTVRGRRRLPGPLRKLAKIPVDGSVNETWTLGYLVDTIYLRDLWMHRVDAARATGRTFELTADHDGRIVADVVREWARRHGRPFVLTLTGPAGATFAHDPDDPGCERVEADAVELCRTLAGRTPGQGLLATAVPF